MKSLLSRALLSVLLLLATQARAELTVALPDGEESPAVPVRTYSTVLGPAKFSFTGNGTVLKDTGCDSPPVLPQGHAALIYLVDGCVPEEQAQLAQQAGAAMVLLVDNVAGEHTAGIYFLRHVADTVTVTVPFAHVTAAAVLDFLQPVAHGSVVRLQLSTDFNPWAAPGRTDKVAIALKALLLPLTIGVLLLSVYYLHRFWPHRRRRKLAVSVIVLQLVGSIIRVVFFALYPLNYLPLWVPSLMTTLPFHLSLSSLVMLQYALGSARRAARMSGKASRRSRKLQRVIVALLLAWEVLQQLLVVVTRVAGLASAARIEGLSTALGMALILIVSIIFVIRCARTLLELWFMHRRGSAVRASARRRSLTRMALAMTAASLTQFTLVFGVAMLANYNRTWQSESTGVIIFYGSTALAPLFILLCMVPPRLRASPSYVVPMGAGSTFILKKEGSITSGTRGGTTYAARSFNESYNPASTADESATRVRPEESFSRVSRVDIAAHAVLKEEVDESTPSE